VAPADPNALRHDASSTGGLPEEIVLHEERVVILKEVVPTERIRLSRESERIELERPGRGDAAA
jgi:stress response protein YsnF